MTELQKKFIQVINDYVADYDYEAVLDELFPGQTLGEVLWDVYELGGIPTDTLEKFLKDDDDIEN